MPQPLRKPVHNTGNDIETNRPEHLAAIGLVIIRWSALENAVSNFFSQLLTYAMAPGPMMDRPLLLAPSTEILEEVSNTNARIKLVSSIAKTTLEPAFREEWRDVHAESIKRLGSQRAKVAHGLWGWSDEHPDYVVANLQQSAQTIYSVKDFSDIANRIDDQTGKLIDFGMRCHQARLDRQKTQQ